METEQTNYMPFRKYSLYAYLQQKKCNSKNIGESERSIKDRISEHITYIRTKNKSQATGEYFNLPGHSLYDMEAIGLEIVYKKHCKNHKKLP